MSNFEGVYRMMNYEPKSLRNGAILILTFHKAINPEEGEKLLRLFKKYVKVLIFQEGTGYHKIDNVEARLVAFKPETLNKHTYIKFSISFDYKEEFALKAVKLWEKDCHIELTEIERELPLEDEEEGEDDSDEDQEEGEDEE